MTVYGAFLRLRLACACALAGWRRGWQCGESVPHGAAVRVLVTPLVLVEASAPPPAQAPVPVRKPEPVRVEDRRRGDGLGGGAQPGDGMGERGRRVMVAQALKGLGFTKEQANAAALAAPAGTVEQMVKAALVTARAG